MKRRRFIAQFLCGLPAIAAKVTLPATRVLSYFGTLSRPVIDVTDEAVDKYERFILGPLHWNGIQIEYPL